MARITQQSLAAGTYANLQTSLARSERLQAQLSSGKQLRSPGDAPGQAANALQLRQGAGVARQYVRNADDGLAWLSTADSALTTVSNALRRARELAVAGANTGATTPASRAALADEVRQLREGILGQANSTYLGRPVFGGTVAGSVAFDPAGAYVGDAGSVQRRVGPNAQVRVDVSGTAAFGTGATSAFAVLETLADDLVTDPASVGASIAALDTAIGNVLGSLSGVGARANRIETLQQVGRDEETRLRGQLAEVEDIDLARTVVDLQLQEVAYQAALGATARVLQPSLLDYLR